MKKALLILLATLVAAGVWIWSREGSFRRTATPEPSAETADRARIRQAISAMVSRNNARTDWEESLDQRAQARNLYTFQVEDALTRDPRPILVLASVDDIAREKGGYLVHLKVTIDVQTLLRAWASKEVSADKELPIVDNKGPDIRFVLQCSPEQVESILRQGTNSILGRFAFVALVSSVDRPALEVKAKSAGADKDSTVDGSQLVVESSSFYVARGKCLELMAVGDYELQDSASRHPATRHQTSAEAK